MKTMKRIVAAGALIGLLWLTPQPTEAEEGCIQVVDDISVENFNLVLSQIDSCQPATATAEALQAHKDTLTSYEAAYRKFTLSEKRQVVGYDNVTAKKEYIDAILKVTNALDDMRIATSATSFSSAISRIRTDYIALSAEQREFVYNSDKLTQFEQIATAMQHIASIRVSDAPALYKEKIRVARVTYNALPEASKQWVGNYQTLQNHEGTLNGVLNMEMLISALQARDVANLTDEQIASFLNDLSIARTIYDEMSFTSQKLVEGFEIVEQYEKGLVNALKVNDTINAINPYDRSFYTKTTLAVKQYERLSLADRRFVQNYLKLETYMEPANIFNELAKLRTTSRTYAADVVALRARYDALTDPQKLYVTNSALLTEAEDKVIAAQAVESLIRDIPSAQANVFVDAVAEAEEAYKALDAGQRKLVGNYADLRVFQKTVKNVTRVEQAIDAIDIENTKFTNLVTSAQRLYDRLLPTEQIYVQNKDVLENYAPVSQFLTTISKLRTTSRTYRDDVLSLRHQYEALTEEAKRIAEPYGALDKLQQAETMIAQANYVDDKIAQVGNEPEEYFIARLAEIRAYYNDLSKEAQKLVLNYKQLQALEKEVKPVLTVAALIVDMTENPRSLMAAFDKAQKSYARLTPDQKRLVYNFYIFEDYEQPVAVSKKIKQLRPSNRYFLTDLADARSMYDGLEDEQQNMVENVRVMIEAEMEMRDVNQIVNGIQHLSVASENYVQEVRNAEQGYKQLGSSYRKLVVNYNHLKDALKLVKKVERVMTQIDAIETTVPAKRASKITAARKAYDKLDDHNEKPHVSNYMKLLEFELTNE